MSATLISTPRLTPLPAYNRGCSNDSLSPKGDIPGHSNGTVVHITYLSICHIPTDYSNSPRASCRYSKTVRIGVKPRRVHWLSQRPVVTVTRKGLIRIQLLKRVRSIPAVISRYYPSWSDGVVVVDIEILQQVLLVRLAVYGHILSIVRCHFYSQASDSKLPEGSPDLIKSRRAIDPDRRPNGWIDSSVVESIESNKVIS